MTEELGKLTECENQVLLVVWELEGLSDTCLGGIIAEVNRRYTHEWKAQTVATFLSRIVRKGYLSTEKKGRRYCYHPTLTLEQYQEHRLLEMLEELFRGDVEQMAERIKGCI